MSGKAIMVQGTSSNAGKSVLVTALCRIFRQDGFHVAPFKSQNMSLNSYVTADGREIGRAQGVQAEAAGIEAEAIMNPILLKPSGHRTAQVVLLGKPVGHFGAREYREDYVMKALPVVEDSLRQLKERFDLVVIEGAGSPAEVNLKDRDIANMRVAAMAEAPVLLVGDIDRGGVLASFVGTLELLEPDERARVAGLIVNKFRGDPDLLKPGLDFLETRTGKPVLGVIPYFEGRLVDEEDSVALQERKPGITRGVTESEDVRPEVAIIQLPHISNFTDFAPLEEVPGLNVRYVRDGEPLGSPDALILPGTKNTAGDLTYLRRFGYDQQISELVASGTIIVGICGGYQMLGRSIKDPLGVESPFTETPGLGLLDVVTTFGQEKETRRVTAEIREEPGFLTGLRGEVLEGYEIHMGQTVRFPGCRGWMRILRRGQMSVDEEEGAVDSTGQILGTYMHDLFHNPAILGAFVRHLRGKPRSGKEDAPAQPDPASLREQNFDRLAAIVRENLDLSGIYALLGLNPVRR